MSQKNQSSSNDTSFSFGANAAPAQAINDTPGSQESGGGGTMSYRCAWKYSINEQLHCDQPSWCSSRRKCQKINIGKISPSSKIPCYGRWQQWPEPVGHGHAGGWGRQGSHLIQTQAIDQRNEEWERGMSSASTTTQHREAGKEWTGKDWTREQTEPLSRCSCTPWSND